jgi:ribosomal protein S18 acetylase RimI-like enzyme
MVAGSYRIRAARPGDADAATAIWQEMADEHAAYDGEHWAWSDDAAERWRSDFLDMIAKKNCITLVAVDEEGRAVGFVTADVHDRPPVFASNRAGGIGNLAVKRERRRRGIGKMLAAAAMAEIRRRGAEYIKLSVARANAPAIGLYESLGFRDVTRSLYKRL